MFSAELDRSQGLLKITAAGDVEPEEVESCLEELRSLLADIPPGFRLLTDLSGIDSMPTSTAPSVGQIMELLTGKGLASVVRILPPEHRQDIGFAILSRFHYGPGIGIVTCANLEEAAAHLAA